MPSLLHILLQPLFDALSPFSGLSLNLRLRLLALLPLSLITFGLVGLRYQLGGKQYEVFQVPLPRERGGGSIRCIVYNPPASQDPSRPRPLHISIHGGAFVGGTAEYTASFCETISSQTGCVAVGISYRFAPRNNFPTIHDDVRDVVRWVCRNSERLWGANGEKVTVSGFSAGANLSLDLATAEEERNGLPSVEGWVGFYTPLDLRTPPWSKAAPPGFPNRDPMAFFLPLFNTYGASAQALEPGSKRANPCLRHEFSDLTTLPNNMLFIIAGTDILLNEQLEYVQALEACTAKSGGQDLVRLESQVYEEAFHGWVELPNYLLSRTKYKASKDLALEKAVEFLLKLVK